ncbi:MAG: tol-pal system YbgF family protein [Planctomycetota bacterium]
MRAALLLSIALPALAAGCRTAAALPAADAEQALAEAERRLAAGDGVGARDLLLAHEESAFAPTQQPRFKVLLARAHLELGAPWQTFLALRDFADDHPHSELRDQVIDLEFRAGSALARSDAGFLFFWSDRRGARTCLEHLITRYPTCVHLADALRILGEMALEDRDYPLAEERFRDLLRRQPESEWAPLARFRFAMSLVGALRGPDYDLERMESATKELRVFLASPPENPQFVAEATAALAQLLDWRSERHVRIADFYRRVGNLPGEIEHLHLASTPEFATTAAADEARRRLAALGDPPTLAAAPGGGR